MMVRILLLTILKFAFHYTYFLISQIYLDNIISFDYSLCLNDGPILLRKKNGQLTDRIRKNLITLFKEIDFKIEIEINLKIVNFLDFTFNLESSIYTVDIIESQMINYCTFILFQNTKIIKHPKLSNTYRIQ